MRSESSEGGRQRTRVHQGAQERLRNQIIIFRRAKFFFQITFLRVRVPAGVDYRSSLIYLDYWCD